MTATYRFILFHSVKLLWKRLKFAAQHLVKLNSSDEFNEPRRLKSRNKETYRSKYIETAIKFSLNSHKATQPRTNPSAALPL
jgi:hypothetical protein